MHLMLKKAQIYLIIQSGWKWYDTKTSLRSLPAKILKGT